jgi:hypothetical protein
MGGFLELLPFGRDHPKGRKGLKFNRLNAL